MMVTTTPIEDIEDILRLSRICPLEWNDYRLTASLYLQASQRMILNKLNESEAVEVEVRQNGQLVTLSSVQSECVEISISPPRGSHCCLAKDEEDLLSIFNLHRLPDHFALFKTGYKTWADDPEITRPDVIRASEFIKELERNSILEVTGNRFTLITYDQKISMAYLVNASTVRSTAGAVANGLKQLKELLSDALHGHEKKRLIRNALISSLKSCDESSRLAHLLGHCDEILENAQQNYELFVSNFSFSNDVDKLNEQKREFSVKLNGLLVGIQGKLLAIPVSTILATTQLKDAADESHLLINSTVLSSSLFFWVIIIWLIRSQMIAINSIRQEILQKEKRFRYELPKLFSEVTTIFESLKADCELNLKMAWTLIALSYLLTIITCYVYSVKTPEVGYALTPLFEWGGWLVSCLVAGGGKILTTILSYFCR